MDGYQGSMARPRRSGSAAIGKTPCYGQTPANRDGAGAALPFGRLSLPLSRPDTLLRSSVALCTRVADVAGVWAKRGFVSIVTSAEQLGVARDPCHPSKHGHN